MYSATFALTAIFGIALTNLFLGYAFAVLIGRGPRSLSDLENVVTIRYFSPRLLFPFTRRTRKHKEEPSSAAPAAARTPVVQHATNTEPDSPTATPASAVDVPPAITVRSIAIAGTTPRLVLQPKSVVPPEEVEPPEVVLGRQLEAWQASDAREETPCLSGFVVTLRDGTVEDHVRTSLLNAVCGKITNQLRKDRRVLRSDDNHFLWFSPDVHPDDGLMPVGRIRQIIDKTRFLYEGAPLTVETHAAVVAVTLQDHAEDLIRRVQGTLKYAQQKGGRSMCVDFGDGPAFVEPLRLDIDESEFVLA